MIKESFIKPTDYKKWFTDKEVFCDTGSLINKFMTNTEIKEILWGLTDCLKDFFVAVKGIVPLDEERLYKYWFFGKTTERTFFLNYALSRCLYDNIKTTEDTLLDQRDDIKENKDLWYEKLCDDFDKSLYFNFRYTQSKTVNADNAYIDNAYRTDSFYCQHYRDFVKAAEIDVLLVGGEVAVGLLGVIYPELQGKLTYCGEPAVHDGVLFVSIPHPSRISYAEMSDVINKIAKALKA